jgi:hypothetical protein
MLISSAACNTNPYSPPKTSTKNDLSPTKALQPQVVIGPKTATPSITITSTWTNPPSLSPDKSIDMISRLLRDNGGCELPCWWGVKPGETSWQTARNLILPLAMRVGTDNTTSTGDEDIHLFFTTQYPASENSQFQQEFVIKNQLVQEIHVNTTILDQYSHPSNMLMNLGRPDEIFVGGAIHTVMNNQAFYIALYYRIQGVLSIYETGLQDRQFGSTLDVCFPKVFYSEIYLWNPRENFDNRFSEIQDGISKFHYSLDSVTNMTNDEFYNDFKNQNQTVCFATPEQKWLDQ